MRSSRHGCRNMPTSFRFRRCSKCAKSIRDGAPEQPAPPPSPRQEGRDVAVFKVQGMMRLPRGPWTSGALGTGTGPWALGLLRETRCSEGSLGPLHATGASWGPGAPKEANGVPRRAGSPGAQGPGFPRRPWGRPWGIRGVRGPLGCRFLGSSTFCGEAPGPPRSPRASLGFGASQDLLGAAQALDSRRP